MQSGPEAKPTRTLWGAEAKKQEAAEEQPEGGPVS
jgi:hypothetical protein